MAARIVGNPEENGEGPSGLHGGGGGASGPIDGISYSPRKASMGSVLEARLAGHAEAASASSSIAMAESAGKGLRIERVNFKQQGAQQTGIRRGTEQTEATANSRKFGAGTQDDQHHSGALAAKCHAHRHFRFAQCHGERRCTTWIASTLEERRQQWRREIAGIDSSPLRRRSQQCRGLCLIAFSWYCANRK